MATGDQNDFVARLRKLLPVGWFPDNAPILNAVLTGLSAMWAWAYDRAKYLQLQTRIATATEQWLDLIASDFIGNFPRRASETDAQYRARIQAAILQVRGTRPALSQALTNLTGIAPIIFEPRRIQDTGAYNTGNYAYNTTGGYGSMVLPYQCFIHAFLPITSPISVAGFGPYGDVANNVPSPVGYGIGSIAYAAPPMIEAAVSAEDVYNTIVATLPAATVGWTAITSK